VIRKNKYSLKNNGKKKTFYLLKLKL